MIDENEGGTRSALLFEDLRRVIRGHTDSLDDMSKHVLIIDALSQTFAAAFVEMVLYQTGQALRIEVACAQLRTFPWDSALEAALVNKAQAAKS